MLSDACQFEWCAIANIVLFDLFLVTFICSYFLTVSFSNTGTVFVVTANF